jgi:hypothetical protein
MATMGRSSVKGIRAVAAFAECSRNRVPEVLRVLLFGVCLFPVLSPASPAQADDIAPIFSATHSQEEIARAQEAAAKRTDPKAAAELPHQDLSRSEAQELLQSVFGPVLEAPAGIFDDLQIDKFLSDNVAIVPADGLPDSPGDEEEAATDDSDGPMLLDSTVPLRAETDSGKDQVVDLGLERAEGQLQPANPVVDVGIPTELGEGIDLPDAGVQIGVVGTPENRAPTMVGESVAFYPNVAQDVDLVIAPTPTGVETFSQLRSPDSPRSQTFSLDLPDGANLQASSDGGAEAALDGKLLLRVLPPTALDAHAEPVPVELEVADDSITVTAVPNESTSFPVILDPIFDTYEWYKGQTNYTGWTSYTTPNATIPNTYAEPIYGCTTYCFLRVSANSGWWTYTNAQTYWHYMVPRFQQDYEATGTRPTSWVQNFSVDQWVLSGGGEYQTSPGGLFAVSNEVGAWQSASIYPPNASGGYGIDLGTNHSGKMAGFGLFATQNTYLYAYRYVLAGYAQVGLGDGDSPSGTATAPKWVNTTADPISFDVTDPGLGVYSMSIVKDSLMPSGVPAAWTVSAGCTGVARNACPRTWKSGSGVSLPYDPSTMPSGINELTIRASDPLGNTSSTTTNVKVDHLAPQLTIGGSLTEQATLGTTRPTYTLKVNATDGTEAAPQSGIASVDVKVDGKLVQKWTPGCTTKNCALSSEWTFKSGDYPVGKHSVEVIATDAVGIKSSPKTLSIETQKDLTAPGLSISGSLKTSPGGWINQPSTYSATAIATDGGYGVTKLAFSVDGAQVASATQGCSSGGCALNQIFVLKSSSYTAGIHTASITATDGAGNPQATSWSFKVNPNAPSPVEVASTANSLIPGSGAASPASMIEGFPYEPSLMKGSEEALGNGLEITGSGARGTISLTVGDGFSASGLSGLPFVMEPIGLKNEALIGSAVADGDGVAYPEIDTGTDLLARPIRNGVASYLVVRKADGVRSFTWEVAGPNPLTLSQKGDGGVDITITPPGEVRDLYATSEEGLSEQPQVVATIAPPDALDGAGKAVPASLSVNGSKVTLNLAPSPDVLYPLNVSVQLHINGPLATWNPSLEEPSSPSEVPVTGITVGESGTVAPIGDEWTSNQSGTEITTFIPDDNGIDSYTQKLQPPPGTMIGGTVIQQPVGEYRPESGATASCFLGICAGGVVCSAVGPAKPYNTGGPIQTYAVISCSVHGDPPKDFAYERGGACLQRRFVLGKTVLWATEKCHTIGPNFTPPWAAAAFVTTACPDGIWRGEAWVTVALSHAIATTSSLTDNRQC